MRFRWSFSDGLLVLALLTLAMCAGCQLATGSVEGGSTKLDRSVTTGQSTRRVKIVVTPPGEVRP